MKNLKFLLAILLMAVSFTTFAMVQDDPGDPTPNNIVVWLTPFIVLAATWIIRKLTPVIPGWATMIVVSGLSAAVAWISGLLDASGDMSWLMQTLYGLLSVFIHQLYKQFIAPPDDSSS